MSPVSSEPLARRPIKAGLSLFWRTFWFLFFLMLACLFLWAATVHRLGVAPRMSNALAQLSMVIAAATGLAFVAAAFGARLINQPLNDLSFAASRVREGNFAASRLNEDAPTPEVREVNVGFNRMAVRLAQIEQDRAIMLAGISHDLRTPLARLRLETEMSVQDTQAREHMAADIEQLDRIIDKFLDYARPESGRRVVVCLNDVVDAAIEAVSMRGDVSITNTLGQDLFVMGDPVDLERVVANLIENARRYGKAVGSDKTDLVISAKRRAEHLMLQLRDHGPGVRAELLTQLTKPFFRGDTARTSASGAGLGLAIVEKAVQRMGGNLSLHNAPEGGLVVTVTLLQAPRGYIGP